ncbi:hypothetical protein CR513_58070, partial [Mucuna pruriens]
MVIPQNFCEIVIEPFDETQDPHTHLQAFQTQVYINRGDDRLRCKLFPGTLRGVAMHWLVTLPPQSIRTFSDLATSFASQFTANKTKHLEVADLFDIMQNRGRPSKVTCPALIMPRSELTTPTKYSFIEEIRARVEKHIEVEEDQTERVEAERQPGTSDTQPTHKGENKQPFNQEIDKTQVPPNFREVVNTRPPRTLTGFPDANVYKWGNDKLSCKLFPGTLRGVAMQWMATLPARTIRTFNDLASAFVSQFAANKAKKLEVANLFDIRQAKGEIVKNYLARFNNAIVQD